MGKLIAGSFLFIGGLFICATGVGAIVGIPMFIGGFGMAIAGMGSLGKTAVKTGVTVGKTVNAMQRASADRRALEEEQRLVDEARAKLAADRAALQAEGGAADLNAALSRPTPAT